MSNPASNLVEMARARGLTIHITEYVASMKILLEGHQVHWEFVGDRDTCQERAETFLLSIPTLKLRYRRTCLSTRDLTRAGRLVRHMTATQSPRDNSKLMQTALQVGAGLLGGIGLGHLLGDDKNE